MINDLNKLMTATCDIAYEAGEKIMQVYQQDFTVIEKADKSPLTEADMAAHHYIIEQLAQISDYPILSEESAKLSFEERSQWSSYWLVDPLDGTKQFVQRTDEFCVCIALIHQHKPVLGVIYLPVEKSTYYACNQGGAFKSTQATATAAKTEIALQTNKIDNSTKPWTIAVSRSHSKGDTQDFLNKLGEHKLSISGSAIKACWVAEGKADLYPRLWPTSEWDTAAAQCILEQSGGELTTLDGLAMQYNTKDDLTNPYFLASGQKGMDWSRYL
jgi:3'(2'), 5'-bisphosphate nucleotidase